jgi:guanine deaminase
MRLDKCSDILEELFVLGILGDDRAVKQTWSAGQKVHDRDQIN